MDGRKDRMTTNNSTSQIVSDFLSGKVTEADTGSTLSADEIADAGNSTESEALEDYGTDALANDSTVEDLFTESNSTPTDQSGKAPSKADGKQVVSANKESITITDDKGRRQIEIDYSDKEAIKKAFQFQYGARKWQAERDQAITGKKSLETEYTKLKADWEALDSAFNKGPEHLFDILKGQSGSFDKYLQERIERAEYLRNATPDEIQALEVKERAERLEKENKDLMQRNQEFMTKVEAEREQAEMHKMESQVTPVFDKYRFAEKLGNPENEQMFDEMLWNTAMKRLIPYEEQGILTPELIDREFRNVSAAVRKQIGVQAEKQVSKVVDQKKREATENVQAKVMSGYKTGGSAQEAKDLINKGDLTTLLKGWGKYGSLFNK